MYMLLYVVFSSFRAKGVAYQWFVKLTLSVNEEAVLKASHETRRCMKSSNPSTHPDHGQLSTCPKAGRPSPGANIRVFDWAISQNEFSHNYSTGKRLRHDTIEVVLAPPQVETTYM